MVFCYIDSICSSYLNTDDLNQLSLFSLVCAVMRLMANAIHSVVFLYLYTPSIELRICSNMSFTKLLGFSCCLHSKFLSYVGKMKHYIIC